MSELQAHRLNADFLIKLFFALVGIIIISVSGLMTLFLAEVERRVPGVAMRDEYIVLLFSGGVFVLICVICCYLVLRRISNHIHAIERL